MRAIGRSSALGRVFVALTALALCFASAAASPEEKRRVVLGTSATFSTFDPHVIDDSAQNLVRLNVYDGLARWVGSPPRLHLWLAHRHDVSPRPVPFHLRSGAFRQHPVRAADVVYSMERMLALKKGPYPLFADVIAPGGTRAVNESTVVFNLVRPMQGFAALLPELAVVNRTLVAANEKNNDWGQEWLQRNSAGSGGYIPFRRDREGAFVATRFSEHFMPDGANAIEEFSPSADRRERARRRAAQRQGRRDRWATNPGPTRSRAPGMGFHVVEQPTLRLVRGVLHNRRAPTSGIDFRRALAHAFDYEGLTRGLLSGTLVRNGSPLPDLLWGGASPSRGYRYDLAKAREYLQRVPGPIPEITIGAIAGQPHAEMAAAVLKQGLDALGLKSRVVAEPAQAVFARSHDERQMFDVLFMVETRLPPDPDPWIRARYGCKEAGRTNYSWYCSDAVDALVAEARRSSNADARWRNYSAAATLIEADAADLWIGTAVRLGVFGSPNRHDVQPSGEGLDLRWASMERREGRNSRRGRGRSGSD